MMKKLIFALFAFTLFLTDGYSRELRYRNVLVRDFRTVWNGEVINYNIGTAAHCPGTLSSLRRSLPSDVRLTVWADTTLSAELDQMMRMGFPDIKIVYGSLEHPSEQLRKAVEESDLCLVSSGSGIAKSVRESLEHYKALTGKPTAAYAIGYGRSLGKSIAPMDFCWIRDEKALEKARKHSVSPADGWAPDAVFDFDVSDEKGADEFLLQNGLKKGNFLCCIPGFRHTPTWEFYGTPVDQKKKQRNDAFQGPDNAILRAAVCEAVRNHGCKVLICAEQIPELRLCKEEIYDRLPEDVRKECVLQTTLWSPQLALGVYKRSLCVFGIEMHSQVMAAGNGIPACIFRHSGFGTKSDMFNTVGLGCWLLDIDEKGAERKAVEMISDILSHPAKARKTLRNARKIIDRARDRALSASFLN